MLTLGALLFLIGGLLGAYGTGGGAGALVIGLAGAALIVAALVIHSTSGSGRSR